MDSKKFVMLLLIAFIAVGLLIRMQHSEGTIAEKTGAHGIPRLVNGSNTITKEKSSADARPVYSSAQGNLMYDPVFFDEEWNKVSQAQYPHEKERSKARRLWADQKLATLKHEDIPDFMKFMLERAGDSMYESLAVSAGIRLSQRPDVCINWISDIQTRSGAQLTTDSLAAGLSLFGSLETCSAVATMNLAPNLHDSFYSTLLSGLANEKGLDTALDLLGKIDTSATDKVITRIISQLDYANYPDLLADVFNGKKGIEATEKNLAIIASLQSATNPEGVAKFLESYSVGKPEWSQNQVSTLVGSWYRMNPQSASAWVAGLKKSGLQKSAAQRLANELEESGMKTEADAWRKLYEASPR